MSLLTLKTNHMSPTSRENTGAERNLQQFLKYVFRFYFPKQMKILFKSRLAPCFPVLRGCSEEQNNFSKVAFLTALAKAHWTWDLWAALAQTPRGGMHLQDATHLRGCSTNSCIGKATQQNTMKHRLDCQLRFEDESPPMVRDVL